MILYVNQIHFLMNLYILILHVLKIDKTGFVTVLIDYVIKPYGLHISNNTLFVSSQGENSIVRFNLD